RRPSGAGAVLHHSGASGEEGGQEQRQVGADGAGGGPAVGSGGEMDAGAGTAAEIVGGRRAAEGADAGGGQGGAPAQRQKRNDQTFDRVDGHDLGGGGAATLEEGDLAGLPLDEHGRDHEEVVEDDAGDLQDEDEQVDAGEEELLGEVGQDVR